MLNPDDRYYTCEDLRKLIHELVYHAEDALTSFRKPYNEAPDEDAPFFEKLFWELIRIEDNIKEHSEKLYAQWSEWDEESREITLDDELDEALSWIYLEGICGDGGIADERGKI